MWRDTPPPDPNSPKPSGIVDRVKQMEGRTRLLLATGAFLLVIAVFFQGCRGVEIEQEQAVRTAIERIDFGGMEPERTEARVLRQGIPTTSQWVVVFRVNEPGGGPEDFLCHARVYIDAASGELRRDADFGESTDECPWVGTDAS